MKQYRTNFLAVALAAVLASCATQPAAPPTETQLITDRYPISVTPEMRNLRVPYATPQRGFDPNSAVQIRAFVRDYRDFGSGALSVSTPPGWAEPATEISQYLTTLGVAPEQIMLSVDPAPELGREVRLSFIRYSAHTEPCGDWSSDWGFTLTNKLPSNFGCAVNQNVAAMVADPRDLITPKPMAPGDVQRWLTILDKYRKGEPTATMRPELEQGNVAEVTQQ